MTKTTMYRNVRCSVCEYTQIDSVSYYLHAKAWKANHNLDKCWEIRKSIQSKNAFDKMFSESLDSLANLTIIK